MKVCKGRGIQNELSLTEMLESNAGSGSGFCLAENDVGDVHGGKTS